MLCTVMQQLSMKAAAINLHIVADIPSLKLSSPFPKIVTQCIRIVYFQSIDMLLYKFALICVDCAKPPAIVGNGFLIRINN